MKRTLILLSVLFGLIIIIAVSNYLSAHREQPLLFKGFVKEAVMKITVAKYGTQETLKLENKKWFTTADGSYPADSAKVNQLLTLLADQRKGDFISKNPAKHADLRVDSANGTKVTVEAGKNLWTFYVGNMAQGFTGNYLRFDGQNPVYVSKGSLDQAISTAPNFYRDKGLLRISKDDINEWSIVCKDPKDSTKMLEIAGRFSTEKGQWKFEKPEAVDGDLAKVNDYLAKFQALETDEWYDRDTTTALGFDTPVFRAQLKKNDGTSLTLLAGNEKNGKYYVKVEGDPVKYLLQKYRIDGLKPNWDELKSKGNPEAAGVPQSGGVQPQNLIPAQQ